jgi:hypothetical protein
MIKYINNIILYDMRCNMSKLMRKNIMIDNKKWEALEILKDIKKNTNKKVSVSNLINDAVNKLIEEEIENNLAFKIRMIASFNGSVSEEEENDILEEIDNIRKSF